MKTLENVVPRKNLLQTNSYILACVAKTPPVRIQGDVFRVRETAYKRMYAIIRHGVPIAWLYLTKRKTCRAWEVLGLWVSPVLRNKGFGTALYRAAINCDGIFLASGKTQSKFSKALWAKFVRNNEFTIWAEDFATPNQKSAVSELNGELHSDLEIYSDWASKKDVRLLAIRRML